MTVKNFVDLAPQVVGSSERVGFGYGIFVELSLNFVKKTDERWLWEWFCQKLIKRQFWQNSSNYCKYPSFLFCFCFFRIMTSLPCIQFTWLFLYIISWNIQLFMNRINRSMKFSHSRIFHLIYPKFLIISVNYTYSHLLLFLYIQINVLNNKESVKFKLFFVRIYIAILLFHLIYSMLKSKFFFFIFCYAYIHFSILEKSKKISVVPLHVIYYSEETFWERKKGCSDLVLCHA